MLIARWRSLLSLKISPNLELLSSKTFHSTSIFSENSRKKFGSSGKVSEGKRASKNSIRLTCTIKEKRSDTKKALHNLLFPTRGSRDFLQYNEWYFGKPNRAIPDRHIKKKSPPGRGKNFRSAALKWHPDKHQGPSQEAAQEKFKRCLDAYKSLCCSVS